MAFDPFLYIAFAVGFLAGRVLHARPRWVPWATLVTVGVLVGLLGASLSAVPWGSLVATVPLAAAFALLILGLTAGAYLGLSRFRKDPTLPSPEPGRDERLPVSLILLAALLIGIGLGHVVAYPAAGLIPWVLYLLLALVGFEIPFRLTGLRAVWLPLSAATVGAVAAAAVFALAARVALPTALATTFAFGFYSLAGPLIAARAGALLGLLAFLTNFLREDLTMLLSPYLGRRLRGAGLAALGGATAMDTTLYFVTRYGDPEAGSLALASGLILTVAASLLLPALLTLPL